MVSVIKSNWNLLALLEHPVTLLLMLALLSALLKVLRRRSWKARNWAF